MNEDNNIVEGADPKVDESAKRYIKSWQEKIKLAKKRVEVDFKRMREDSAFASGLQWNGQKNLNDDRYIANWTIQMLNKQTAQLYARNPKAVAKRRELMDYVVWDGSQENLIDSLTRATESMGRDIEAMAVVEDYKQGCALRDLQDKIGKTLTLVYQWNIDNQQPTFKLQMKQLVRRTKTCGVGYVKIAVERSQEQALTSTATESTMGERAKTMQGISEESSEGEIQADSADMEKQRLLVTSLQQSMQDGDMNNINERLVFDFPKATAIIVDPRCTSLKGFIGARWLAQEYIFPVQEINDHFGCAIKTKKTGGSVKTYTTNGDEVNEQQSKEVDEQNVCVWEVFDLGTKSTFYICDGYDEYVQSPAPVEPETNAFFPIFALTFNDIEAENGATGTRTSIYPPSDVRLMRSMQKEWNRSREGLRKHRAQNSPKYLTQKGTMLEADKEKLATAQQGELIEIQQANGNDISKLFVQMPTTPIDPTMYDTSNLRTDLTLTLNDQEPQAMTGGGDQTATSATITEQSRISTTSSNVDDINDLLTGIARSGGEMLLQFCSVDTAKRVAGRGAVWPAPQQVKDYLNHIFLEIEAGSNGRPNKAVEISNFERLYPAMVAAGVNPKFILEQAVIRLDDQLDINKALPVVPPQVAPQPMPPNAVPMPQQPLQAPSPVATPFAHAGA